MQRRNALMVAVGAAAACAGAGLAWWRLRPSEQARSEPEKWAALWQLPFQTRDGKTTTLASFKGQKIIVNFWATWCPPCVDEMPLLDRFYRENSAKGWQVAGIAVDQAAPVKKFIEQKDILFPNATDGAKGVELSRALGNQAGGLPYTVVLDQAGKIVAQKAGRISSDDLQQWLAR
jgi:thiol-disulfide isomerase/thioredoxin